MYINININGDNESVAIIIKQAFTTNSIQELFNVKERVNVIKIISFYLNQYLKLLVNNLLLSSLLLCTHKYKI